MRGMQWNLYLNFDLPRGQALTSMVVRTYFGLETKQSLWEEVVRKVVSDIALMCDD